MRKCPDVVLDVTTDDGLLNLVERGFDAGIDLGEFIGRDPLILETRRDVRVVEGARLEIALAVCDGVLRISITVADPAA